jgi:hypothetical protein
MLLSDSRGLPVSTHNSHSLDSYERALGLLLGYYGNPLAAIDAGLAEDPEFVSGLALRAGFLVIGSELRAVPELQSTLDRAASLVARGLGNERERAHFAAARQWLSGDLAGGADRYNRLAFEQPRDLLAQQVAHICNFFLGRAHALRDQPAAALAHYAPGEPGYGYLRGMHAFGLEECGEYALAEAAGRAALANSPRDAWAVHAVAHCFEMQARLADGASWLESREAGWAPENFFAVHNYWHLALFRLDMGDHARVLELYDGRVRAQPSEMILDMVDASALLWRLELAGVEVGPARWRELAECWKRVGDEGYYAFNDWHALIAYAAAGMRGDVARVLEGLSLAARGQGTNAQNARLVGLPLCAAFAAFADGDYARATDGLFAVRPYANLFGGSHAQRDLIEATLLEAAIRGKQLSLARGLAEARKVKKPHSPGALHNLARVDRQLSSAAT